MVVVVRYFGGTLLGVPGLIEAYKSAASLALQVTPIIQKPIQVSYRVQFDYTQMNEIMMLVKTLNCQVLEKDMNLFCHIVIGIPKGRLEEAIYKFKEIRNVEITKVICSIFRYIGLIAYDTVYNNSNPVPHITRGL